MTDDSNASTNLSDFDFALAGVSVPEDRADTAVRVVAIMRLVQDRSKPPPVVDERLANYLTSPPNAQPVSAPAAPTARSADRRLPADQVERRRELPPLPPAQMAVITDDGYIPAAQPARAVAQHRLTQTIDLAPADLPSRRRQTAQNTGVSKVAVFAPLASVLAAVILVGGFMYWQSRQEAGSGQPATTQGVETTVAEPDTSAPDTSAPETNGSLTTSTQPINTGPTSAGPASTGTDLTVDASMGLIRAAVVDPEAVAVPGVIVDLFADPDEDGEADTWIAFETTGADGGYEFSVEAGCYVFDFVVPDAYQVLPDDQGRQVCVGPGERAGFDLMLAAG